ncbi:MAG TPA: hypothetical protein DD490_27205, partial [Acidobacteria bacterium]|nr:hypothetical protein [Acidobacteriota bacterium]
MTVAAVAAGGCMGIGGNRTAKPVPPPRDRARPMVGSTSTRRVDPMKHIRKRRARKRAVAVSGAAALGALVAGIPAGAATFTVSNLGDSGTGSLRQAVTDANGAAGADIIAFQAGLTGTITLTTGQLDVTDSVDVQGPGAAALTVSGNNASRVFDLYSGAALLDVTLAGLTLTGGNAADGGAVRSRDENLTLDGVTLTGNRAAGSGGGLWTDGPTMGLTVRNATISGNTAAGGDGGGLRVGDAGGAILIEDSTISGNDASTNGGGIELGSPNYNTTLDRVTISGNSAGEQGGGLHVTSTDGGVHFIRRTTISGNDASGGGGLFLDTPNDPFILENSTISGNQATAGDGGGAFFYDLYLGVVMNHVTVAGNTASGSGGGLFTQVSPATIDHSIVADNTAGTDNDVANGASGRFDVSFTLLETPGTATVNDNGANLFSQDPQLGPLQNNGGPNWTQRPAGTSPVVNAGAGSTLPTDQRGVSRPSGVAVDLGAVEVSPGTIELTASAQMVGENAGTVTITATRTGGTDGPVSVAYNTAAGSAVSRDDFAA